MAPLQRMSDRHGPGTSRRTGAAPAASRSVLLVGLVVALLTSGCFGGGRDGPNDDDRDQADDTMGTLRLSLMGYGRPAGSDNVGEVEAELVFDHIGFASDGDIDDALPVLAEPAAVVVALEDGFGAAVSFVDVPIEPGDYTDVEAILASARLLFDDAAEDTTTMDTVCFAPTSFTVSEGEVLPLTLVLDGAAAFERSGDGWTARPALSGALSDTEDGDLTFDAPQCH